MDRAGYLSDPVKSKQTSHRSLLVPSRWPIDLRMLVAFYLFVTGIVAYLAIVGPFDAGTRITRAELGPAWPLTIAEGTLHCEFRGEIIVQHGGTAYSLTRHDKHSAYTDVAAIQIDDRDGNKKDLSPLIERGRRLCD